MSLWTFRSQQTPRRRGFRPSLEELQPRDLPSLVIYDAIAHPNDLPGFEGPGRILRIDAQTGAVKRLYAGAPGTGEGPSGSILVNPGAAIAGTPLVVAPGGNLLFEGTAGNRIGLCTLNPNAAHPRPRLLNANVTVQSLAVGPHSTIYGITDSAIVTINPRNEQITTLWQDTAPLGTNYLEILTVRPNGRLIFTGSLHNNGNNAVYQLDLSAAHPAPTLLANDPGITAVASGPHGELYGLEAIRGAHGAVLSLEGANRIVRIDPATGKETTVFQGKGARFDADVLTTLPDGTLLVHGALGKRHGVFEINPHGKHPQAHLLAANIDAGALAVAAPVSSVHSNNRAQTERLRQ